MSDEKAKHYNRKPKHILVVDCIYLSTERDRLHRELVEMRKSYEDAHRKVALWKAKAMGLGVANGHLATAVTTLRDVAVCD